MVYLLTEIIHSLFLWDDVTFGETPFHICILHMEREKGGGKCCPFTWIFMINKVTTTFKVSYLQYIINSLIFYFLQTILILFCD